MFHFFECKAGLYFFCLFNWGYHSSSAHLCHAEFLDCLTLLKKWRGDGWHFRLIIGCLNKLKLAYQSDKTNQKGGQINYRNNLKFITRISWNQFREVCIPHTHLAWCSPALTSLTDNLRNAARSNRDGNFISVIIYSNN